MTTNLTAVFDGETLRPEGPVDLERNRRYRVWLQPVGTHGSSGSRTAWDVLEELEGAVDAPVDWAHEHDHYLYGTARRDAKSGSSGAA